MTIYPPQDETAHLSAAQIRRRARDLARRCAAGGRRRIAVSAVCRLYGVSVLDALRILVKAQDSDGWPRMRIVDDTRRVAASPTPPAGGKPLLSAHEVHFLLKGPGVSTR